MRIFTATRLTHYEVAMLAYEDIKRCEMDFVGVMPTKGIN